MSRWIFAISCIAAAGCGRIGFAPTGDAALGGGDGTLGPDAPAGTGLIGWWKLDELGGTTASDSAGNNPATLLNSPTWVTGKINNGVRLDGTNQYLEVPDSSTLVPAGSWTASMWVRLTSIPADTQMYTLLAKSDVNGNETYSIRLDDNYGAFGATGPGSFIAQFATASSVDVFAVYTPATVDVATWYCLTAVWDQPAMELSLYVDGALMASAPTGANVPTTLGGESLLIGDNPGHLDQPTAGDVDDIRIYDRALGTAEIANLFSGG